MARLTDPLSAELDSTARVGGGQPIRRSLEGKHVCPFCGSINARTDEPCPSCGMENTPATRNSTRGRVGPWYVLQKRNPAAPGMKFETLIKFIRKGRIQPRAVLRGPTTSQLWRFAATVKGVSREFGICYNCGGDIEVIADTCKHCSRDQRPPVDPNALLENNTVVARPASTRPQPLTDDVDMREDTGFGMPVPSDAMQAPNPPRVAKPMPAPEPDPVSPAPAFTLNTPTASKPQPRMPEVSIDERDRREIEAGREKRAAEPRDPNKNSPTLSARELATAFQLDFTPTDRKRRRGKSHKGLYTLLTLLVLGGAGTAAWFKVPQFHDAALNAYTQASAKIQSLINGNTPATKPSTPSMDNFTFQSGPMKPIATPTPAPKLTLDEAYALESKLWRQALDSEAKGDYAAAVKAFEQIKALPAKAQPNSLDLRLANAKAKLGQ